jgi:hypothetical protein
VGEGGIHLFGTRMYIRYITKEMEELESICYFFYSRQEVERDDLTLYYGALLFI